jgi:threonine dehydratase
MSVTIDNIREAARRIESYVHRTPVMTSELVDEVAGCQVFFKCENLQKIGAFKARGAHNAVLVLSPEEQGRGVATHSSGNHAAALSLAAQRVGIPAYIVMPKNAPATKIAAVRAYGGEITFCEPTLQAREETADEICRQTGACLIPPYDYADVIAGQGTCVLELTEQLESAPDVLITPVGGGGLLSGSAIVARTLWPDTRVIGAEPAGADDAQRSFRSGERQLQLAPDTIADGLRSALGEQNFDIIRDNVDDILTADDSAIVDAMKLSWTRMKLVIEPSAAVALAVVLVHPEQFAGSRVAIVLSGGNVDLERLPW